MERKLQVTVTHTSGRHSKLSERLNLEGKAEPVYSKVKHTADSRRRTAENQGGHEVVHKRSARRVRERDTLIEEERREHLTPSNEESREHYRALSSDQSAPVVKAERGYIMGAGRARNYSS